MDKKILVTQSSIPLFEEYTKEIKSIFETKWLTNMGEKHNELEEKLKKYLNVDNITLFTNGHMALLSVIHCMNFPKGGEVITTPFSFSSTTHAIVENGLKPVFCDINETDYTIDVGKIEELITEKTVAIIPVHVYGNVCNVEEILSDKLKGDLNSDNAVNVSDVVLLQKKILGYDIEIVDYESADIDENKKINVIDLALLKEIVAE